MDCQGRRRDQKTRKDDIAEEMPALQHPNEADDAAKGERADDSAPAPAERKKGGGCQEAEAGGGIAADEGAVVGAGSVEGEGRGVGERVGPNGPWQGCWQEARGRWRKRR